MNRKLAVVFFINQWTWFFLFICYSPFNGIKLHLSFYFPYNFQIFLFFNFLHLKWVGTLKCCCPGGPPFSCINVILNECFVEAVDKLEYFFWLAISEWFAISCSCPKVFIVNAFIFLLLYLRSSANLPMAIINLLVFVGSGIDWQKENNKCVVGVTPSHFFWWKR